MAKDQSMIYVIDDDASVRKAFGRLWRSANLEVERRADFQAMSRASSSGRAILISLARLSSSLPYYRQGTHFFGV